MSKKSKSSTLDQVIGLAIIGALAWAWWRIGGVGGVLDLVLGPLIGIAAVALLAQLWRVPAVKDTKAGPTLFRMHVGGMRLLGHPRVAVPVTLAGALLLPPAALAPALAAVLWALGRAPKPEAPRTVEWFSETHLVDAFDRAGIWTAHRAGHGPPWLSRRGHPRSDPHGWTVDLGLPAGMVAADVTSKQDRLAGALGVPLDRLIASAPPGAPAGVIRLFVGHPPTPGARPTVRPSLVTTMTRTDWHAQPRIGATKQGEAVWALTNEANTLVSGLMGFGKTSVARQLVCHALLDPKARVWIVDGKGSRADWGAAEPSCEGFILGTMLDAVEQVEAMLTELVGIVQARNDATDRNAPGHKPGALVLLLDEWQDIRAAADKKAGERIDTLLGRVVRMGRAVGVHAIVVTQRPTVEDVPSGVRNLLSQRVALVTRNAADAALVLGETPTLPLPTKKGEALIATPTGTVAVTLDYLSGEAWETVCRRAAALRPSESNPPADRREGSPEAPETFAETAPKPSLPIDPTLSAVVDVLADGPPQGMTAAAILAALPEHLQPRPPSVLAMGKALAKWARADDPLIRFKKTPELRLWQLTAPATAPATAPGGSRQDPPGPAIDPPFTRHRPRQWRDRPAIGGK